MGLSFADLLTQESIATIRARMAAALLVDGFPVASWAPSSAGGVENMRLDMSAGIGVYLPPRIVDIVNGRILPLASGDYLKALGARFYGLTQREATYTIQNIALYAVGSPGSYAFNPGDLWVKSDATGNRYQSVDGGQFSAANTGPPVPGFPGNPLMLRFQAESPGSKYADVARTITTMVTARAGVRCVNVPPADFTPASVNGTSTGTMMATIASHIIPPAFQSVRVAIEQSGDVAGSPPAMISISIDGGSHWQPAIPIGPTILVSDRGGGAAILTFANSNVSPSFVAGDIYTTLKADAILQRGADAETEAAFKRRCSNRWPSLSDIPVAGTIDLWAHEASPEVDKVSTDADLTSAGIRVTIASSNGPASPAAQIAVEDYINARLWGFKGVPAPTSPTFPGPGLSPTEFALVISAQPFNVTATGPVRVPRDLLATAEVAANVAWIDYLAGLPLGGQDGSTVELAKLAQILADAGAIDIPSTLANLKINDVSADAPVPIGEVAVPAPGTSLLTTITWIPV